MTKPKRPAHITLALWGRPESKTGKWFHIAVVLNNEGATPKPEKFYVNGSPHGLIADVCVCAVERDEQWIAKKGGKPL